MFFLGNTRFACHKPIWKSKAPPRCKFFMWLAVHGRCLTADNLERRNWPSNGTCTLCSSVPETCSHLFVHCDFIRQVWTRFRDWTGADFIIPKVNFSSMEDWWLKAREGIPKPMKKNFDTIVILLHWRIWKERNARIFDNVATSADRVRDLVIQDIHTWRAVGCICDLTT